MEGKEEKRVIALMGGKPIAPKNTKTNCWGPGAG